MQRTRSWSFIVYCLLASSDLVLEQCGFQRSNKIYLRSYVQEGAKDGRGGNKYRWGNKRCDVPFPAHSGCSHFTSLCIIWQLHSPQAEWLAISDICTRKSLQS